MKRIHLHIGVGDLDRGVDFYTRLLGQDPDLRHPDYASWSLDSPALNLALSTRCGSTGVSHVGVESDDPRDVERYAERVADAPGLDEGLTTCCYARSTKRWVEDPDGVSWELFHTEGRIGRWSLEDELIADAPQEDPDGQPCCPLG